jgi:chromosome segregation ATPase
MSSTTTSAPAPSVPPVPAHTLPSCIPPLSPPAPAPAQSSVPRLQERVSTVITSHGPSVSPSVGAFPVKVTDLEGRYGKHSSQAEGLTKNLGDAKEGHRMIEKENDEVLGRWREFGETRVDGRRGEELEVDELRRQLTEKDQGMREMEMKVEELQQRLDEAVGEIVRVEDSSAEQLDKLNHNLNVELCRTKHELEATKENLEAAKNLLYARSDQLLDEGREQAKFSWAAVALSRKRAILLSRVSEGR